MDNTTNNNNDESIDDQGGYWTGTDKSQNESVLVASSRRQSILDVQVMHGAALQAMQERFPGASSHELVRFLKARKFNETKAIAMYEAHLQWRQATFPIPNEDELQKLLATRKFYMLEDLDGDGRPVILYCLRRFKDSPYDVDKELQAIVYLLEHQVRPRFGPSFETQKMTVLIDISGIRSPPIAFLQKLNAVMEANYPEMLFRSIMFPVPFWLQKIIQGCLTFVAEETREKFAYVNDIKSLEEFAMIPLEQMGPDIAELAQTKQLKK